VLLKSTGFLVVASFKSKFNYCSDKHYIAAYSRLQQTTFPITYM